MAKQIDSKKTKKVYNVLVLNPDGVKFVNRTYFFSDLDEAIEQHAKNHFLNGFGKPIAIIKESEMNLEL